jgi:hypothetical protein
MSGLLRRLTRRRPATADENRSPTAGSSEPAAAPADAPAEPGGGRPVPAGEQQTRVLPATGEQPVSDQTSPGAEWAKPTPAGTSTDEPTALAAPGDATTDQPTALAAPGDTTTDQPTAFAAQPVPVRDLPAGVDPGDLAAAPAASARRGKLRRRLRYLRQVRELLLRDLGGFTYEVHRTAGGTPQESHRRLSAAKASRISALDAEVGALEARLGEPHAEAVLREAGIGGTCPECGELHASDAHFCSRCGAPLDAKARAKRDASIAAAAQPVTASQPTPEAQPASVLWAGGPRPSTSREPAPEKDQPASVTSEWLTTHDQPTTFDRAAQPDAPAADEAAAPADEATKPAAADEAAATPADEPTAADEAAATPADEPAAATPADEAAKPTAADEAATTSADEPAVADQAPAAAEAPRAKPKRASRARKAAPKPADDSPAGNEGESGKSFEPGPNGRRDDDVPPPVTSGDPLASQREQAP